MSGAGPRFRVGDVGPGATVLQGEYLSNISLNVSDVKDAAALLQQLGKLGKPVYYGPLLRRLDPIVLVNRADTLRDIAGCLEDVSVSVIYLTGLAGVGKSTLARGAIAFRHAKTPAVWITCEGLDAEQFVADVSAGLQLELGAVLGDGRTRLSSRIAAVLGAVTAPCIIVLDGLEALLDAQADLVSPQFAELLDALATLEHRAKVLVTTRHLPREVGDGSPGVRIVRVGGLSYEMADALLQTRTGLTLERRQAVIPDALVERLHGHPKFIELLASVLAELPPEQIAAGLLETSDIGAYVTRQVFDRMSDEELGILRAALVFRGVFGFDALTAVRAGLDGSAGGIAPGVRSLVRRAVLERAAGGQTAYYLHPILRDAVQRTPEQEAAAHAGAAAWFRRTSFDAAEIATWDGVLYHLRRAAEVGRDPAHLYPYFDYLIENQTALSYAGWGRRLVTECTVLTELADDPSVRFLIEFSLGVELWQLDEYDEAIVVFRELDEALSQLTDAGDADGLAETRMLIQAKLGSSLVQRGYFEEARRLADAMDSVASASGDVQCKLRHRELRFDIARKVGEPAEIMHWARACFDLAQEWVNESPSPQTQDALAEAHFAMGIAHLRHDEWDKTFTHLAGQLRIKLEIGKVGGVAGGLFNLGAMLQTHDPVTAAAALITSEQIASEIGGAPNPWRDELADAAFELLAAEPASIAAGREALALISPKLLPSYEGALARRLQGVARPVEPSCDPW